MGQVLGQGLPHFMHKGSIPIHPDGVWLVDSAWDDMYMCIEEQIEMHLKQEIKERIGKDENVEMFSLLPLKK